MEQGPSSKENLNDEFKSLGKNLVDAVRTVWDRPEFKNLQGEIESGLSEFGSTVKKEFDSIKETPAAQEIKSDMQDIQERYRSGEMETKIRQDLINILQSVNTEIEKFSQKLSADNDQ